MARIMANLGKGLESEVALSNEAYENRNIALVQKISTPWKVVRQGKQIVSAYPEGKSTLDFRGTIKGGISISFDCKESEDEKGLPLSYIQPHQIDYMRKALLMDEVSFLLCHMKKMDRRYRIPGIAVMHYWNTWQENKGKPGYNYIPVEVMKEVQSRHGIVLDYLEGLDEEG